MSKDSAHKRFSHIKSKSKNNSTKGVREQRRRQGCSRGPLAPVSLSNVPLAAPRNDDSIVSGEHQPQLFGKGLKRWFSYSMTDFIKDNYGADYCGFFCFGDLYDLPKEEKNEKLSAAFNDNKDAVVILRYKRKERSWHDILAYKKAGSSLVTLFNSGQTRTSLQNGCKDQLNAYFGRWYPHLLVIFCLEYEVQNSKMCAWHSLCAMILLVGGRCPAHFRLNKPGLWKFFKDSFDAAVPLMPIENVIKMISTPIDPPPEKITMNPLEFKTYEEEPIWKLSCEDDPVKPKEESAVLDR